MKGSNAAEDLLCFFQHAFFSTNVQFHFGIWRSVICEGLGTICLHVKGHMYPSTIKGYEGQRSVSMYCVRLVT